PYQCEHNVVSHLGPAAVVFCCDQRDSAFPLVAPRSWRPGQRAPCPLISLGPRDRLGTTLMLIQHGGSKFESFITLSPEHARNLFAPRFAAYFTQLSKGATASYFFRHHELGCRRRCHGRQMGNAKHLMAFRQLTHARADGVGDFATDVRVNLIK